MSRSARRASRRAIPRSWPKGWARPWRTPSRSTSRRSARIRALGHPAPAGFKEFRENSVVDAEVGLQTAEQMVEALIADNEAVARRMRDFSDTAAEARDTFSEGMLIGRMGAHEANVWMLRALIAT